MRNFIFSLMLCGTAVSLHAQAAPIADTWEHLKATPVNAHMHVSGDKMSKTCYFVSADDESLTCSKGGASATSTKYVFPRAEVKSVKRTRYALSTLAGTGIGAGVGLGIGLAGTQNKDAWFNGAVRGICMLGGAVVGAVVGGPTDFVRGPVVYRRIGNAKP